MHNFDTMIEMLLLCSSANTNEYLRITCQTFIYERKNKNFSILLSATAIDLKIWRLEWKQRSFITHVEINTIWLLFANCWLREFCTYETHIKHTSFPVRRILFVILTRRTKKFFRHSRMLLSSVFDPNFMVLLIVHQKKKKKWRF